MNKTDRFFHYVDFLPRNLKPPTRRTTIQKITIKAALELMRPIVNTPPDLLDAAILALDKPIPPFKPDPAALGPHILNLALLILHEMIPDEALEYLQGFWSVPLRDALSSAAHIGGYTSVDTYPEPAPDRDPNHTVSIPTHLITPLHCLSCAAGRARALGAGQLHPVFSALRHPINLYPDSYDALSAEMIWMRSAADGAASLVTNDINKFVRKLRDTWSHQSQLAELVNPPLEILSVHRQHRHSHMSFMFLNKKEEYEFDQDNIEALIKNYQLSFFFEFITTPYQFPMFDPATRRIAMSAGNINARIRSARIYGYLGAPTDISTLRDVIHLQHAVEHLRVPSTRRPAFNTSPSSVLIRGQVGSFHPPRVVKIYPAGMEPLPGADLPAETRTLPATPPRRRRHITSAAVRPFTYRPAAP